MTKQLPDSAESLEPLLTSKAIPDFDHLEDEFRKLYATEETDKPKKRGKKKTEIENESPILEGITADDIESWVCFPLDALFERTKKKRLSRVERLAWSDSCSKLINKWLPEAAKWGPEIGAAICLATIVAVRYEKPSDSGIGTKGNGKDNVDFQEP